MLTLNMESWKIEKISDLQRWFIHKEAIPLMLQSLEGRNNRKRYPTLYMGILMAQGRIDRRKLPSPLLINH